MVKKVITNLDSSKVSGPDCIPVVVLRNCELELSYIPAELFSKCLKESCLPHCWKASWVLPVFKNVGERSPAKKFLKSPFLVLYFSYYTVINFLMLSAILLSTLSALFSTTALSSLLCDQASDLWNNSS